MRYYFRRRGEKAIPLRDLPGSEEFMAAYAMALAAAPDQPEIGASRTMPGTINALMVDYYRSAEWRCSYGGHTQDAAAHHRALSCQAWRQTGGTVTARAYREDAGGNCHTFGKAALAQGDPGLLRFAVPTMRIIH